MEPEERVDGSDQKTKKTEKKLGLAEFGAS